MPFFIRRWFLKGRTWVSLLLIYIIWGSTYLAIRFAVETIPPLLMAATRFLVPGIILYAWQRLKGEDKPTLKEWKSTGIIGLLLMLGGNGGVTWAEQYLPSGLAALIIGSVPLWIIVINMVVHRDQAHPKSIIIGAVIGFLGIALLIGPDQFINSSPRVNLFAIIALLLAAFFWSLGSIYSRTAIMHKSPLMANSMEFLTGGMGLLLSGLLIGEGSHFHLQAITLKSVLSLSYLIIFGSLIGFVAYTWLLRNAPISLVSTYAYVNPVIAIFIGNWLANEPLNLRIIISALVIISSVFMINTLTLRSSRSKKVEEQVTQTGE